MKCAYVAANPLHARLIVGLLEQHGIVATIQGEGLWGMRGELPFTSETAPSVWVDDADASRAAEILRNHESIVNPAHCPACGYDLRGLVEARCPECGTPFNKQIEWTCGGCGEEIEGQFTHCWKCGAEKPRGGS
jgi:hypothetical protein